MLTAVAIGPDANATGVDSTPFKITEAKRFAPVVTLSTENNAKSTKHLNEGFSKRNKYKVIDHKIVNIAAANEGAWFKLSTSKKIICSCLW